MQTAELTLSLWEAGLVSDGALADWMSGYLSANAPTTPLLVAIQQHGFFQGNNRLNGALLTELLRAHSLPKATFDLMLTYQLEGLRRACLSEEVLLVFLIRHFNDPDCPPFFRHAIEVAESCWIDQGNKASAWKSMSSVLDDYQQHLTKKLEKYRHLAAELLSLQQSTHSPLDNRQYLLVREGVE